MICKVLMAWKAQGVDDLRMAILQRDFLGRWRDLPLVHQEGVDGLAILQQDFLSRWRDLRHERHT
jgi:hypothetical protein